MVPSRNSSPNNTLRSGLQQMLEQWNIATEFKNTLTNLEITRLAQQNLAGSVRQAAQHVIVQALERLTIIDSEEGRFLVRRYLDGESTNRLANEFNWAESTLFRKQKDALTHLTDIIVEMEQQANIDRRRTMVERLAFPTYTRLIGVDEHLDRLIAQLISEEPPWLLSIEGLGGLGKTALADALARRLIEHQQNFGFAWVTAKQQIFNLGGSIKTVERPALSAEALIEALFVQLIGQRPLMYPFNDMLNALMQRLHKYPHILFIDNLETVLDVDTLLPVLRKLVDPSRIVLTTRHSLFQEGDVFHFSIPELSESNALTLVRFEAAQRNLPDVSAASDADLRPIFVRVGGNPLAIRLVVGQLHIHSLDAILADLLFVRSDASNTLYTYVYRRVWEYLNEIERNTLLAMPMVPEEGGTLDFLATISQIDESQLHQAINQLVTLNLIDVRGDLHKRLYTIHSLTRSFLHRQIAFWDA